MVIGKGGQFFLLAAVIIFAVVISFSFGINEIETNKEPDDFYDYSYEVRNELGEILDYAIFNNTGVAGGDLEDFVDKLVVDIRDSNPGANFLFIYGDSGKMEVLSYWNEEVDVGGTEIPGLGESVDSEICVKSVCNKIKDYASDYKDTGSVVLDVEEGENITIKIKNKKLDFMVSGDKRVVFIIQRSIDEESYLSS